MKRYWDLSRKQRAALTDEQVQEFGKIELMERGVIEPKPPVLAEIKELKIPKSNFTQSTGKTVTAIFRQEHISKARMMPQSWPK